MKAKTSVPPIKPQEPYFALPIILPPDEYIVEMSEPEALHTRGGRPRPFVRMKCTVLEGRYKGRTAFHQHFLSIPELPNTEDEIRDFKPIKARVRIDIKRWDEAPMAEINVAKFLEAL